MNYALDYNFVHELLISYMSIFYQKLKDLKLYLPKNHNTKDMTQTHSNIDL